MYREVHGPRSGFSAQIRETAPAPIHMSLCFSRLRRHIGKPYKRWCFFRNSLSAHLVGTIISPTGLFLLK